MTDKMKAYKEKLERGLAEYMSMPVTERSAAAIDAMIECWERVCGMERELCGAHELGSEQLAAWNAGMVNDDGTTGGHWTTEQTSAVADSVGMTFERVSPAEWNAAMNMMYSDYCGVGNKYGVSTPGFYADMAHAFLFDKDGGEPRTKLAAYYDCIVAR